MQSRRRAGKHCQSAAWPMKATASTPAFQLRLARIDEVILALQPRLRSSGVYASSPRRHDPISAMRRQRLAKETLHRHGTKTMLQRQGIAYSSATMAMKYLLRKACEASAPPTRNPKNDEAVTAGGSYIDLTCGNSKARMHLGWRLSAKEHYLQLFIQFGDAWMTPNRFQAIFGRTPQGTESDRSSTEELRQIAHRRSSAHHRRSDGQTSLSAQHHQQIG